MVVIASLGEWRCDCRKGLCAWCGGGWGNGQWGMEGVPRRYVGMRVCVSIVPSFMLYTDKLSRCHENVLCEGSALRQLLTTWQISKTDHYVWQNSKHLSQNAMMLKLALHASLFFLRPD